MKRICIAAALLCFGAAAWAYDSAGGSTFQSATAAYSAGEYQKAESQFRKCLGEIGDDPTVHFNIAMTCLRLEQRGLAMAHLLASRSLSPRDDEVQRQLRVMRAELDQIEPPPASWLHALWGGLRDGLTYDEVLWFAALVTLATSGLLGLWLLTGRRRFQWPGIIAIAFALVAWGLAGAKIVERIGPPAAIVTDSSIPLRGGPGEEFGEIERLSEGSAVTILERPRLHVGPGLSVGVGRDDLGLWAEVRAASGARGYARRNQLAQY